MQAKTNNGWRFYRLVRYNLSGRLLVSNVLHNQHLEHRTSNTSTESASSQTFSDGFPLKSLNKLQFYYKNNNNQSCLDLTQNQQTKETGCIHVCSVMGVQAGIATCQQNLCNSGPPVHTRPRARDRCHYKAPALQ